MTIISSWCLFFMIHISYDGSIMYILSFRDLNLSFHVKTNMIISMFVPINHIFMDIIMLLMICIPTKCFLFPKIKYL